MIERNQTGPKQKPIVSAVLDDGTLIEAIYRPSDHHTMLVSWRDGIINELRAIELPLLGHVVPFSPTNNLLTHGVVLLPSEATGYASTSELLAEVRSFIHRYADLSEAFEEIASYYVLLTWIYDAFNEVPYLRLRGDYGTGKSRCLLTIGSLCYKPMFASGASTVSPLFRIIDAFRGTLVVDESDFRFSDAKAEIIKILNNGNAAGFPVLRSEATPTKEFNPRAFNVFGPKIIATRGAFDDRALESRCITETMNGLPPRADIPLNLPRRFHDEARALRNQLLMYRFNNRNAEWNLGAERDAGVEARIAQVFAPLVAIAEDPRAQERIRELARGKSGVLAAERSASVEAQLLDIMFHMRRDQVPLGVGEITERFAQRFASDYQRPITARWIGAQLRNRLSLVPVKSHGTFMISAAEEPKLHSLFERYHAGDDSGDVGRLEPAGSVSATQSFRKPRTDRGTGQ